MKSLKIALLLIIIPLLGYHAYSEKNEKPKGMNEAEKKGYEIMKQNYRQMTTKNFRSDVVMKLIDKRGNTQTRHLKRLSKTDGNDLEKYLMIFLDPPTIRNTSLLMIERADRDDDIWFYFSAIKKIKRLSGANMSASYIGTEFSYKDLKREKVSPERNRYVYIRDEKINGVTHHLIRAYPVSKKEKAEQGYHHRNLWIRSDNYLASRIEFFDEDGDYLKRLEAKNMKRFPDCGKTRYITMTMTNNKGIKTVIEFKLIHINTRDPDDKYFTRTFLFSVR